MYKPRCWHKNRKFLPQIQRTLFDKFSNLPFLFSVKNTGCVIEPQFLANVGTFCVDAVLGHNVSTINLNGQFIVLLWLLMGKEIPLSLILLLTLSYIRAKAKLNVNLPILLIERRSSEDSIRRLCTAGLPVNRLFYWLMRKSPVCFNLPQFLLCCAVFI